MTIWDQVLARVETKVNRHSFSTWFADLVRRDAGDARHDPGARHRLSGLAAEALLGGPGRAWLRWAARAALTFVTEAEANTSRCRERPRPGADSPPTAE